MTAARRSLHILFALSSAAALLSLLELWQWFWHTRVRSWDISLQGITLLALLVVLGVFTWKAMRAVRTFAETAGRSGLVIYSGYVHLAIACVPAVLALFVSEKGWEAGYTALMLAAIAVCAFQAVRYNSSLQILRSLVVQLAFPPLFVFLAMFAAVHVSSEENREEEEIQAYKDRDDMAGLRAYFARKEELARSASQCGVACYASITGVFGLVSSRFLNRGIRALLPVRASQSSCPAALVAGTVCLAVVFAAAAASTGAVVF